MISDIDESNIEDQHTDDFKIAPLVAMRTTFRNDSCDSASCAWTTIVNVEAPIFSVLIVVVSLGSLLFTIRAIFFNLLT